MLGRVRVATVKDAAAIAAIYAPYVTDTAISFETEPPSPAEMAGRIRSALPDFPYLAFEEDGRVLGYAYGAPTERARPTAGRWTSAPMSPRAPMAGV
jgi:phosphinothricin acetyltransferase